MKKFCLIFILLVIMPFCLFGCDQTAATLNEYTIICTYDDSTHILHCSQSVVYENTTDNILTVVKFFLYANSFMEGKEVVTTSLSESAYPNGESYGYITFSSVSANGEEASYEISNDTILTVSISELYPDESVEIDMEYDVQLANINHRLGYGEYAINFGNFFPIACVYDNGFVTNSFNSYGDPFYSDVANFSVQITYDSKFKVATSGSIDKEVTKNSQTTTYCTGEKIRDFCFVLSDKFEVITSEQDGVTVKYFYYDDENAQGSLALAVSVLQEFSDMFGRYPYNSLSVVQTNFCFGGMEYPNLVYVSGSITGRETYNYVIVHELAHQWWYGLVGNNEYAEAWLDESLTEYSTALFFERHTEYGYSYENIISGAEKSYQTFVEIYENVLGEVNEVMSRSLGDFATEPEYVNLIYTRGILMFDSIRSALGDTKFFDCLKDYFEDYCYKNASGADLIASFSKTAKRNLEGYFLAWLNGEVVLG